VTMLSLARPQFVAARFRSTAGTDQVRLALEAGRPAAEIVANWQPALERFRADARSTCCLTYYAPSGQRPRRSAPNGQSCLLSLP